LTAEGRGTGGIMRRTGKAKTAVWRWQGRFMQAGVDGPLRDKTRPSCIPPLAPEMAERVVALTLGDPPGETAHWTAATMAKASGISASAVRRIWRSHGFHARTSTPGRLSVAGYVHQRSVLPPGVPSFVRDGGITVGGAATVIVWPGREPMPLLTTCNPGARSVGRCSPVNQRAETH
jgi:hypothetical protein